MTQLADNLARFTSPPNENGCQIWTGSVHPRGYGRMRWRGKKQLSHRLAWESVNGPIPPGLCVCHKCDVPACVNPVHLWVDTLSANHADMMSKGRGVNPKGVANGNAKLTDADVVAIRDSTRTQDEDATFYGVSRSVIGGVRRRKTWRHVP